MKVKFPDILPDSKLFKIFFKRESYVNRITVLQILESGGCGMSGTLTAALKQGAPSPAPRLLPLCLDGALVLSLLADFPLNGRGAQRKCRLWALNGQLFTGCRARSPGIGAGRCGVVALWGPWDILTCDNNVDGCFPLHAVPPGPLRWPWL